MYQKLTAQHGFAAIISLLVLVVAGLALLYISNVGVQQSQYHRSRAATTELTSGSTTVRGVVGDLWADVVIGKRDFTEIAAREIVPYKLFNPGGVIVDTSISQSDPTNPGRMFVWDSSNNRILGVDLKKCYGQTAACNADIVIGQPSASDHGACNLDSSFQTYPKRPASSANTVCGSWEGILTALEDKTFTSMYADPDCNT